MLVSNFLKQITSDFNEAGIESPVTDAQVIVAHVLGMERFEITLNRERTLTGAEEKKINALVKRRLQFEPLAYLVEKKEFYSLDFYVNKNVLIPRPETELLVDLVIYYAKSNASVLDLGTGSGAIAVSVKHNRKDLDVYASDISESAIKVARKNSLKNIGPRAVKFLSGNLFESSEGMRYDIIATNPPYVDKNISGTLQKELHYEPDSALYADDNGKKIVKQIVKEAGGYMQENGILIIEIGWDMREFITSEGERNGYSVSVLNDNAGHSRVAVLKFKN